MRVQVTEPGADRIEAKLAEISENVERLLDLNRGSDSQANGFQERFERFSSFVLIHLADLSADVSHIRRQMNR